MDAVREFHREDIPQVANLWLKVFRKHNGPASKPLRDYFEKIFFEGQWRNEGLPSLVYDERGRGLAGFLGVIPRVMTFNKQLVHVAVATQLMVDDGECAAYAAVKLMRRFLAGKQGLSLSDGANEDSSKLWRAAGGDPALLYSLTWTRVLRPTQYVALLLERQPSLKLAARTFSPVCRALDAIVCSSGLGRYWLPGMADEVVEEELSEETLLWCIRRLSGHRALNPEYDLDSLRWLLKMAKAKKNNGALRKSVIREANGEIIGWYLYYIKPGDVSQVLQYGGRPQAIRKVLNRLFYQAWKQGAVAISGQLEPRFASQLAQSRCGFTWPGYGVLVQSKNKEVLNAIHQGNAFLTRLEGEWWARFSDPDWSADALPSDAHVDGVSKLPESPRLNAAH